MEIKEHQIGDILIVQLQERRLDAARAPGFREEMVRRIDSGSHRIVLDLETVEFVDSSGLGALVSCLKRLGPAGSLAIAGANKTVARLFSLTRMDRVFALHESVDAAVKQLSSA